MLNKIYNILEMHTEHLGYSIQGIPKENLLSVVVDLYALIKDKLEIADNTEAYWVESGSGAER